MMTVSPLRCERFRDKVALVTGGASGIGLACARRFAREGARTVLADLNLAEARSAARAIADETGMASLAVSCDVSNEDQVRHCVETSLNRFDALHVVVNNAGLMIFKNIPELTKEDWHRVLGVDLLGAFHFIRQAFEHMDPGGAVVNIASIHARETTPLVTAYAAAKSAVISLTRSASVEGKSRGIRVNAVLPGAVDTPMLRENPNVRTGEEALDPSMIGWPEDIAAAVAFLAADEARFVQGAMLVVDGGRLDRL